MNWWGTGLITIIIYATSTKQVSPTENDFLLLDNSDFLLLDGTNLLLL